MRRLKEIIIFKIDNQGGPMTEEELLKLAQRLDDQCRNRDDREAVLEAREQLLIDRLSDLAGQDQKNSEVDAKLRTIEAELRKSKVALAERELELKSRKLKSKDEPNDLEVEIERRLRELKERVAESSLLLQILHWK